MVGEGDEGVFGDIVYRRVGRIAENIPVYGKYSVGEPDSEGLCGLFRMGGNRKGTQYDVFYGDGSLARAVSGY